MRRYPGRFGVVRLTAFLPLVVGAVLNEPEVTTFGIGWWLCALVCEAESHARR